MFRLIMNILILILNEFSDETRYGVYDTKFDNLRVYGTEFI